MPPLPSRLSLGCLIAVITTTALAAPSPPKDARKPAEVRYLRAGPIRLKFADGELRYLCVGDREIVRRVYFSVRDAKWDSPAQRIDDVRVANRGDRFTIDLVGSVRQRGIDYGWAERVEGTPDGRITFRVVGRSHGDFKANRFGLCAHFGAASLAGQAYELTDDAGGKTNGAFPPLIAPNLLAQHFQSLRYTTADGMRVTVRIEGTHFGMEDQRNWGDSSYKAFSSMPHPYPNIANGAEGAETVTISVENAPPSAATPAAGQGAEAAPVRVAVGPPVPEAVMPKVRRTPNVPRQGFFLDVNKNRPKYAEADLVSWPFCPAVNLADGDELVENLATIDDQVKTARSFAPRASLRLAPVTLDPPAYPRPARDPRNETLFGAAWSAAAVARAARAGAAELAFDLGPGPAATAQRDLADAAGRQVLRTTVELPPSARCPSEPAPVEALAAQDDQGNVTVWLINLTPDQRPVELSGLPAGASRQLRRLNDQSPPAAPITESAPAGGVLRVTLSPFEVCQLTAARQ